jgi:hypothetical protein
MFKSIEYHYKVLGLEPGVPFEKVKLAYKDLVAVWHPDRFANNPRLQEKAQEKLKEVNASYEFLKKYSNSDFSELTELTIIPQPILLKVGESIKFNLVGKISDETININQANWSTTGGTIRSDGFFVSDSAGRFTITATIEGISNYVSVSVIPVTDNRTVDTETSKFEKSQRLSESTAIANKAKSEEFPLARLLIWGLVLVIFFTPEPHTLATFTGNIAGVSLLAWIVGLINPGFVIRFGLPSNRRTVTLIYLTSFLVFGQLTQYLGK